MRIVKNVKIRYVKADFHLVEFSERMEFSRIKRFHVNNSLRVHKIIVHLNSYFATGCVDKNARRLKKSWSLNITAMMLKSVLFYPRYVKLGSVTYPALIGHSFPSK